MNTIKKVILTGALTVATVSIMATCSQATTVKVTGDTVNIRKDASTSSEVIAMLSKDVECELLEEVDGWYKIKYKNYTGYISKDYSKKVEDNSNQNQSSENPNLSNGNNNEASDNKNNENTNKETNNQGTDGQTTNSEIANNQTTNSQNNENTNNSNSDNESKVESNNSNVEEPREVKVVYKKFLQNTDVKILPLIYSSKIGSVKKGVEVIIITETTGGWSYIQTDTFNGWVRTSSLGEAKTVTTSTGGTTTTEGDATSKEKVGYVNEQGVNLRKGAGTNYNVVKVLYLNTKVTILKEEGSWYQVKAGNDTGYISKEFVSDTKITSTRGNSNPRTLDDEEKEESDNTNTSSKTTTSNTTTSNIEEKSNLTSASTQSQKTENVKEETTQKTETKDTETKTNNNTSKTEETSKDSKNENENTNPKSINASEVISYAKKYLGCKYVYGGDGSNKTFDCSGFTMYVFKNFGISLPHGATSQYNSGKGTKISKQSDLQMGDIVFLTDYETGVGIGHCGIYIGDGEFIHASTTTNTVTISSLNTMYKDRFYAGLRLI